MMKRLLFCSVVVLATFCCLQQTKAAPRLPNIYRYRAQDLIQLRNGFAQPPAEARPWVYWFWWNSVVSREEVARELEEIAGAGFGGVELRVATFHGWGGPRLADMDAATLQRLGHRQLEYLSDEWLDTLAFTLETAERLGLRFAINLGQGWPPGGPWITDEHRTKHLTWEQHEVTGPAGFKLDDLPAQGFVLAWKLAEDGAAPSVQPDSFLNLDPFIRAEDGRRSLNWPAPAGRWLVGVFGVTPGGLCDKGEGPEVDPASREAVWFHLNYMFSRLDSKVGRYYGKTLVDVASDSWEYTPPPRGRPGRYWSPAILEAFPRLAGYDLREKMHALLGYGPEPERVIHDLENVERQLVRDNFFKTVAEFLHARGLRHRPQIYGRGLGRDLLEAYLYADTPEVEQGDYCVPEAVWAARTTGKPIVSCEAFTHLHRKMSPVRRPHGEWESNPSHLRGAANWLFSRGVNRIQYHSFSYSPPGLPLPGWRMYAELHLNRNVPWWPDLPALNTWMARQQWLLQAGAPAADVLVYPVKSNPDDGPFGGMGDRQPVSAANAVDVANEFTLPRISRAVAAGQGEVGHVLLLDGLKTVAEAESILALMDSGAKLLCAHSLPERWLALRDDNAAGLRERFAAALAEGRVVDASAQGWRAALAELQSVRWSPPSTNLVFQHRRVMGADIYVLFNFGDDFRGEVSFPQAGWRVDRFDADTGAISPVAQLRDEEGRVHLPLALAHAESAAFVLSPTRRPVHVTRAPGGEFDYDAQGRLRGRFSRAGEYKQIRFSDGTGCNQIVSVADPLAVTGPWQLSVSATQAISPQPPLTLHLERLISWRQLPELKHYAGRATYRTEVDIPSPWVADDWGLWLELGEVFELGRVSVNGREAGVAYTPPYRVDLTGMVKPGRNSLEIEVPNQLKNHLDQGRTYRRPSGLLGPVRFVPERRITLASLRPPTPAPPEVHRTNVFVSGEGGYHTYRIPALIETRKGTLLAFCEGRKNSDSDRGDIDLLLRRSLDGGQTWLPTQIVWDDGTNTCGNPCTVVDRDTGIIWLLMTWNSGQLQREADVRAGFGEDSRRVFVTHSSDDGQTWAKPVEITASVKRTNWTWYATGPGNGLQLRNGRLVIPCDHKAQIDGVLHYHSHVIYSDDHGRTWQIGGIADEKTNEAAAVELADGSLLMNMRSYAGWHRRAVARSRDGGLTWSAVEFDPALVEPVCQASLVTARRWNEASDTLLFSNPAATERARMTVRLSRDGGRTWPAARLLHNGPAAYSSLCVMDNDQIGLLYEAADKRLVERLTFARFHLDWLAAADHQPAH